MTTAIIAEQLATEGAEVAAAAQSGGLTQLEVTRAVLGWARDRFESRLVALSSMADEVMVDLAARVIPGLDVAFLDTGYHFAETLGTRDAMAATLGFHLINVTPRATVAEQDAEFGPRLYARDPDRCCALRKVEPLNRLLSAYDAWITGMRRAEGPTRASTNLVELDGKRGIVKINPLALWSDRDVAEYVQANGVPQNPLRQLGYLSIGCEPCTQVPAPGEDARAGRWAGRTKTECGLHA